MKMNKSGRILTIWQHRIIRNPQYASRWLLYSNLLVMYAAIVLLSSACQESTDVNKLKAIGVYQVIWDYTLSYDGSQIAVLTELENTEFSAKIGLEEWQIVIVDQDEPNEMVVLSHGVRQSVPASMHFSPSELDTILYSTINQFRKPERTEMVVWNWATNSISVTKVPFRWFTISRDGSYLATWGSFPQASSAGSPRVTIVAYPEMQSVAEVVLPIESEFEILNVFWDTLDAQILVIVRNRAQDRTILFTFDTEAFQLTDSAEIALPLLGQDSGSWEPSSDLIIGWTPGDLYIYNVGLSCFVDKMPVSVEVSQPKWGMGGDNIWFAQQGSRLLRPNEARLVNQQLEINPTRCQPPR